MDIILSNSSDKPIYEQITSQVKAQILSGTLAAGAKLPSIRALAAESGVNMMTVSKAYQLLKQEGYIRTDRRSGAVVSETAGAKQGIPAAMRDSLRLIVSEAKLRGVSHEEFAALCRTLYSETEE